MENQDTNLRQYEKEINHKIMIGIIIFIVGGLVLLQNTPTKENILAGILLIFIGSATIVTTPQGPEKAILTIKFAPILLKELYKSTIKIIQHRNNHKREMEKMEAEYLDRVEKKM